MITISSVSPSLWFLNFLKSGLIECVNEREILLTINSLTSGSIFSASMCPSSYYFIEDSARYYTVVVLPQPTAPNNNMMLLTFIISWFLSQISIRLKNFWKLKGRIIVFRNFSNLKRIY
jgi:hypothetical protein